MKPQSFLVPAAAVVFSLALVAPPADAQHRGGGSGGGTRASSGGTKTGGSAVSRGSSGGSRSSGSSRSGSGQPSGSRSSASSARASGGGDQSAAAVPRGSRPNYGGRPSLGRAVERDGNGYIFYTPGRYGRRSWYSPYHFYGYGAYGLGSLYFNPYWWGYGPYYPGWSGPWSYWGYPGYSGYYDYSGTWDDDPGEQEADDQRDLVDGGLKLKVEPRGAEVLVDGFYMGIVDDFDGAFQRLVLSEGLHRVEIRADGYQTLTFEIRIEPRETTTYRGELRPGSIVK